MLVVRLWGISARSVFASPGTFVLRTCHPLSLAISRMLRPSVLLLLHRRRIDSPPPLHSQRRGGGGQRTRRTASRSLRRAAALRWMSMFCESSLRRPTGAAAPIRRLPSQAIPQRYEGGGGETGTQAKQRETATRIERPRRRRSTAEFSMASTRPAARSNVSQLLGRNSASAHGRRRPPAGIPPVVLPRIFWKYCTYIRPLRRRVRVCTWIARAHGQYMALHGAKCRFQVTTAHSQLHHLAARRPRADVSPPLLPTHRVAAQAIQRARAALYTPYGRTYIHRQEAHDLAARRPVSGWPGESCGGGGADSPGGGLCMYVARTHET